MLNPSAVSYTKSAGSQQSWPVQKCRPDACRRGDVGRRRQFGRGGDAGRGGLRRRRRDAAALRPRRGAGAKGACCAGRDIHDARRVAETMGFPHYVLDYESRFRESVVEEFADTYLAGATPVPCIRCNERVKFRDLLETARDLDADCMATGHYIRRVEGPHGPELHRAADPGARPELFPVLDHAASSWASCASRSAGWRRRPRRGRLPRATGCRSPTSPTARTSASCRTATMPRSSRSCAPARPSRARSSISTDGSSGGTRG